MKSRANYHAHTFKSFFHTFFPSLFLCISQFLFWCAFVVISLRSYAQLSFKALYFLIPLLLILFVYRFFVTNKLLHALDPLAPSIKPFHALILPALYRMLTGILWLIPFLAVLYRFYQYIFVLPATTFTNDFTKIGAFLVADADLALQLLIGTIAFFGLLFFSALLFFYGWRRGNCFDLAQMEHLSFIDSLRYAKKMRKASRGRRFTNTLLHTLILLPAIIVPCVMPMLQLYPLLTGKAMNDVQLLYMYLSAGIVSDGTLLLSLGLFLIIYLPWLPFRKLHNIAAVVVRHE